MDDIGHIANDKDPYNMGRAARRAGKPVDANPFKTTAKRQAWKAGWKNVHHEKKHAPNRHKPHPSRQDRPELDA